jgi:hypothetical protein
LEKGFSVTIKKVLANIVLAVCQVFRKVPLIFIKKGENFDVKNPA